MNAKFWTKLQDSSLLMTVEAHGQKGCEAGVGVERSRKFLGVVEVEFFVRLRHRMSNWIIFYSTLLIWEFLQKLYNFFWNFCWTRDFLLYTTIPLILTTKFHFLYVKKSEIIKRSESGVGVRNFGKSESDILPPTPQRCWAGAQFALRKIRRWPNLHFVLQPSVFNAFLIAIKSVWCFIIIHFLCAIKYRWIALTKIKLCVHSETA